MLLGRKCAWLIHYQEHVAVIHKSTQIPSKASFKRQISQEAIPPWEAASSLLEWLWQLLLATGSQWRVPTGSSARLQVMETSLQGYHSDLAPATLAHCKLPLGVSGQAEKLSSCNADHCHLAFQS